MLQQSTEEEVSKQSQRQNLWVIVVIESHIYYIKELACVCFLPAKFPVPLCRLAFRWNVPELGTKLVFLCSQFAAETTITKSILIFVLPELQFQFDFDPFFLWNLCGFGSVSANPRSNLHKGFEIVGEIDKNYF